MQLTLSTRIKLANQFGIVKRGSTEVFNDTIKSDGYLIKEVEQALNIDAIQKYLGVNETDMLTLWMWMIDKIEGRELTQPNIDTTIKPLIPESLRGELLQEQVENGKETVKNVIEYLDKPKRGRPVKQK